MLMDQKYTNDQSIPFLSNDELTALLKQLIDPKYQKNISRNFIKLKDCIFRITVLFHAQ